MATVAARNAAQIAYTAWKALFLRTAVGRLSTGRLAWFWLLAEPIGFVVVLMLLFTWFRVRHIGGINTAVWVMAGVLSFLTFRRTASEGMAALRAARTLFRFPQVRPFDPVAVTATLEGLIMILVSILLVAGGLNFGLEVIPADPLAVLEAMAGLWLLGLGYALLSSVALALVPPVGATLRFILTRPLYFFSGLMFPVTVLPYPYRDWLMFNPVVHGVEAARVGFAPYYHVPPQISVAYLYQCAIGMVFLGLALHVRYARRIAAAAAATPK